MSIDFLWDFLQSTSTPEIIVGAGILLCLPWLGIEIQGVRLSDRFRTKRALTVGVAIALLGVATEIFIIIHPSREDWSKRSEAVADWVTIEEKTALPVPDHLTVAGTESEVETMLQANVDSKVQRFIEMWTAQPSSENRLPMYVIEEAQKHLPEPYLKVESQTLFGKRMLVVGHATVHVSLDALQEGLIKAHLRFIQRDPPRDFEPMVPATSVGTQGQSGVQTKLPLKDEEQ